MVALDDHETFIMIENVNLDFVTIIAEQNHQCSMHMHNTCSL